MYCSKIATKPISFQQEIQQLHYCVFKQIKYAVVQKIFFEVIDSAILLFLFNTGWKQFNAQ
jgi:hypothetical protein